VRKFFHWGIFKKKFLRPASRFFDLRPKKRLAVASYIIGFSIAEIAQTLNIKRTTVHLIIKKYNNFRIIESERKGGNKSEKHSDEKKFFLKELIDEDCTLSLKQMCNAVNEKFYVEISKSTAARIVEGFNYCLKNLQRIPVARTDDNILEMRFQYAQNFIALHSQYSEDQLIFIDEVGFNIFWGV
jgi:transposase